MKPKAKKALADETQIARAKLADELGACEERIDPVRVDIKRAEAIRKEIRELWMGGVAADATGLFAGAKYCVSVSGRQFIKVIDIPGVFRKLGAKVFLAACGFTVKKTEELLTPVDREGLVSHEQAGPREIQVHRMPAAAARKTA